MRWLQNQGDRCQSGIQADDAIGMVPVIKMIGPSGRYVIHGGNDQSEVLSPLTIEH